MGLLAEAVKQYPAAIGIELMNEPPSIERAAMYETWQACYQAIRATGVGRGPYARACVLVMGGRRGEARCPMPVYTMHTGPRTAVITLRAPHTPHVLYTYYNV